MTVRMAINGFGRIGRHILRAIVEQGRTDLSVVAINDLAPPETNAHLLRYDRCMAASRARCSSRATSWTAAPGRSRCWPSATSPSCPGASLEVDVVAECTGIFTKRDAAARHLEAGARKVLVSAPAEGADITVCYKVNHEQLRPEHKVVSNASCTTNCLAPVAKVLHDAVGIERGHMTTIHSFTNDQNLLDVFHKDLHRARAATMSIIPTSTGAARAVGLVLPELKGKLDGVAFRVPTPNVSVVDFTFVPKRADLGRGDQRGDRRGGRRADAGRARLPSRSRWSRSTSTTTATARPVDLGATKVLEGQLVRVASWYDNEWGFSCRMGDVAALLGTL